MSMYESIVVGTDGSENAGIAVERAFELARATALQLRAFSETTTAASEPIPAGTVALDASGTRRRPRACRVCEPNEAADYVPHESRRRASRRHREERRCR